MNILKCENAMLCCKQTKVAERQCEIAKKVEIMNSNMKQ